MLKRIISAIVALPLLIAIVYLGGVPLFIGVSIISIIGIREFYNASRHKDTNPIYSVGYIGSLILLVIMNFYQSPTYVLLLFFIMFFALNFLQLISNKYNFIDVAVTLYGILYVPLLLSFVLLINNEPNNIVIWLIFTTAWGTDTCAYFSGYFFGKRKLCPIVSPKKTIEGSIGGILGSVIISTLFGYVFLKEHIMAIVLIGLIGGIVSQIGDLSASLIKRYTGIKDFGNIMPGHGGALDRFDSILFTAPTVYFILNLLINR